MTHANTNYENELLSGWEEIYKRGQLTLWILLSLLDEPKHMADIKRFIELRTAGRLTADDQSMYRALRRYCDTELVTFSTEETANGPDRKVYRLTQTGQNVLKRFVRRNVTALIHEPIIQQIIGESRE